MKKGQLTLKLLAASMSMATLLSCSKNDSATGNTRFSIKMTDAPYNAQEVNIDVKEVRLNYDSDTANWVPLTTNARVYDLLTLQNGRDTVVASSDVPVGNVREIRFILGPGSNIKINNTVYPLTIPSGEESGLKIKINKKLNTGSDAVLLDFDANESIHQTGTGQYKLKPVIKLK